eukprot:SAG22_NODE_3820_length_1515_cov_2.293079_2_plen_168_part_00
MADSRDDILVDEDAGHRGMATLEFWGEDHTLGNALRYTLIRNNKVRGTTRPLRHPYPYPPPFGPACSCALLRRKGITVPPRSLPSTLCLTPSFLSPPPPPRLPLKHAHAVQVAFAGYSVPHPSELKFNLRVQTTGDETPVRERSPPPLCHSPALAPSPLSFSRSLPA